MEISAKSNKTSFNYLKYVIDNLLKCLRVKHKEPLSPLDSEKPEHEATFWSEKKELNGEIFV